MLTSMLDTMLDRTIVGGYSSIGYTVRSRSWSDDALPSMAGKTVLVTGATSGLGLAACEGFARLGADVILGARDPERGERARARVAEHADGGETRLELCDLAQLSSVRELAERMNATAGRLDVLVHNAGVMPDERTVTDDGIELTFAVDVVAPFLLTQLLVPKLADATGTGGPSRVVTVSSGGMYAQKLASDDLQYTQGDFNGTTAYARAKRAEVVLNELWAERLRGQGVVCHSMHPGWADTPGVSSSLPGFYKLTKRLLRTPAQGVDTVVWLGAADEPAHSTGGFWHDRRRRPTSLVPWTRESAADREALWRECERLAGSAVASRS